MSILETLIYIVRFPYEAGKSLDENSGVGPSEWDRESRRFWRRVAWIAIAVLIGIPTMIWIGWFNFTH